MAIFKCKMCGGTIEFNQGDTVGICDSCGTKQTLPRLDDYKKANLYDRANHFRRNNDYDKAASIYEQILNEDSTDAEAYWSLVLCRYGIEYVEDPATHKRVPTVNRAQFTSIFDDDNYKSALHYADSYQRAIYEEEAKAINEIQKGILAISQREEPFDVFICYKETDNSGRRTPDSVLANDLYHQLTQEGFKVFFSRITLEDKLGTAYEPYIFAALNSVKVMVVIGTKPEYFNAVWVKNEWSRYLALIKNGAKKMLIPAYKDMDPYDLPDEFSHLQAQDMSKLGFMQDLIRGIKKIAVAEEAKETVAVNSANANTAALLKRVFMFLEDANWAEADTYCERVLDIDPECAEAYLGKLMADCHVKKREYLQTLHNSIACKKNFEKAIRFGNDALKAELNGYEERIQRRMEEDRLDSLYQRAMQLKSMAKTEEEYLEASWEFEKCLEYEDAKEMKEKCLEQAEISRKNDIYAGAVSRMRTYEISQCETAIEEFRSISGWREADSQIEACKKEIEELKAKAEAQRLEQKRKAEADRIAAEKAAQKRKKIAMIVTPVACIAVVFLIVLNTVIIPGGKYKDAMNLLQEGKFDEAYAVFESLDGYKESEDYMLQCKQCKYNKAISFLNQKSYVKAYGELIDLDGYKDSKEKAESIYTKYKEEKLNSAKIGETVWFGTYEQDNNTDNGQEDIEWVVLDKRDNEALLVSKYALDSKPYNTEYGDTIWKSCSLRAWLNDEFLNNAFNKEEQSMIATTAVKNAKNPEYGTPGGADTKDKVFLLSIAEAEKYFNFDSDRQAEPTAYTVAQGAYVNNGNCVWWLRTPGCSRYDAVGVRSVGGVYNDGYYVDSDFNAIRPALWINLES